VFNKAILIVFVLIFGAYSQVVLSSELSTVTVKSIPIKKYIYLDGTVEAVQQATLYAQTSGRVIKLYYDVDNSVKKGSVIARLRNTEQKARFNQAKAGLDAATAQHKEAELEHRRVTGLYQRKLVSASLKDKAEAGLNSAVAQLNAARARYDEAKEQLDHTIIRAPYSGKVTKRHIEVGETLQIGQPVISGVGEQDALRFSVQVPQRLIEKARKLSTVEIILDDGRRVSSDQITIFPVADTKTHSFQLRAQVFSNQHRLYPGMFVKVAIETGLIKEIIVPDKSIVNRGEISAVYVLGDDQKLRFRQIRLGQNHDGKQVVLAGLSVGEKVVTRPNEAAVAIKAQMQGEK